MIGRMKIGLAAAAMLALLGGCVFGGSNETVKPLVLVAGATGGTGQAAVEQAQRFLPSHVMIYGHFRLRRHLMTAAQYRRARDKAFRVWREETVSASRSQREPASRRAARPSAAITSTTWL